VTDGLGGTDTLRGGINGVVPTGYADQIVIQPAPQPEPPHHGWPWWWRW
jgi:hypothetical protein